MGNDETTKFERLILEWKGDGDVEIRWGYSEDCMECSVLEMDVLTAHSVVLEAWDPALAMTRISTSCMTHFINITSAFVGQIL